MWNKLFGFVLLLSISSCGSQVKLDKHQSREILKNPKYFHQSLDHLTDVIVHDIFSPPVASRVYVYPCVAAHQVLQKESAQLLDLSTKISSLDAFVPKIDTANVSLELAALAAFFKVSKTLIFSEEKFETYAHEIYEELDSLGIPQTIIRDSRIYGEEMADHILAWADKDNYKESRSFSKYTITDKPNEWKPTPPSYMEGIEPHWRSIRPMLIDSAQQFIPSAPPEFDLNEKSEFYKNLMEVYKAVNEATEEHKLIASFWDCNPYVMNQTGHMMFATKKITPGGHWMGISNIASKKIGHDLTKAVQTSTYVAISLFDAFISCWDEKYRSNLIRPETVINEHMDESWIPLLQTPPFPEHTSGHSVISTASATVLTALLGSPFNYLDDVEVKYGLPSRKFNSFLQASEEAAISRLYGGIHYMPAITEGVKQGNEIGKLMVDKLEIQK